MNEEDIQKKVEEFLKSLDVPGFIVFGWKKDEDQFGIISSFHEMPVKPAIKGISSVLNNFIQKTL